MYGKRGDPGRSGGAPPPQGNHVACGDYGTTGGPWGAGVGGLVGARTGNGPAKALATGGDWGANPCGDFHGEWEVALPFLGGSRSSG